MSFKVGFGAAEDLRHAVLVERVCVRCCLVYQNNARERVHVGPYLLHNYTTERVGDKYDRPRHGIRLVAQQCKLLQQILGMCENIILIRLQPPIGRHRAAPPGKNTRRRARMRQQIQRPVDFRRRFGRGDLFLFGLRLDAVLGEEAELGRGLG